MTIRTLEELDGFLAREMAWRKREVSAMRFLIDGSKAEQQATFLRAAVALLYAHWEGYVRSASRAYLEYVSRQGLRYRDLSPAILTLASRKRLHDASVSMKFERHIGLTEFFVKGLDAKCSISSNAISTRSNLSSEVLREIVMTLGLDFSHFVTKETLIDESLVSRRNSIAHGEYITLSANDFRNLSSNVLSLMEAFRNEVGNAAALKMFRA